jgi:hypothetical protein
MGAARLETPARRRALARCLALALTISAAATGCAAARAPARPARQTRLPVPLGERTIEVSLRYGADSNAGPASATGTAIIDTRDHTLRLTVHGLSIDVEQAGADADYIYVGWLTGGDELPLPVWQLDGSGDGETEGEPRAIYDFPARTFDRVVLTVEHDQSPVVGPSSRRSIYGDIPIE